MTTTALTGLDLRIATALQVDPRAPWRRIARVLDEPERSVARRGAALIETGAVVVAGMRVRAETALLRVEAAPGIARVTTEALAQRADTTFAYAVTGGTDCVAELIFDPGRMRPVLVNELPATVGVVRANTYPVLRYFRTIRKWTTGALSAEQVAALSGEDGPELSAMHPTLDPLTGTDLRLAEALEADGRATMDVLARAADVSESTAARRVAALLGSARLQVRALVEPAAVGLPVEALLWMRAAPGSVEELGRRLARDPRVRYAVAVAGEHQVVADVTCRTNQELYALMTSSDWAPLADSVDTTLVLHARKRGGRHRAWEG